MKINLKPKYWFLVVLFVFLLSYSIFQARFIILGPKLLVTSPSSGATVDSPVVMIEGQAKNVAWLSLNDRQIFTDENGNWSEELIVTEGISIMTIKALDRFGREVKRSIEIYLPEKN